MKSIIQKFGLTIAATAIMFTGCKDEKNDPVAPTFSPESVSIVEGSSKQVSILTGEAPFTVKSADEQKVTASLVGNDMTITGVAEGDAMVTVTGNDGGSAKLAVFVTQRPANAPALNVSTVDVEEDKTATVTITGGTPEFTATSGHPNIAAVSVDNRTVTVTGVSMGTTYVTVAGSDGETATFVVSVTGDEQIFFGPDKAQFGSGNKSFAITKSHTIKKGVYTMVGWIYVMDGATLTIEPGTIIKGTDYSHDGTKSATGSSLIIKMGAKIMAEGTPEEPIVFTSDKPKGQRQASDWGGIVILGKAGNNQNTMMIEGGIIDGPHGGSNDDDNSGVLRYVRIEFCGYPYATDNEINGLTLGSVGRGTTIDHIQVSYCGDDSYEWFGGTVNCSHLVAYHGWDDDFDTDNGFSGKLQFLLGVRDPKIADQSNSNGFESDNNANGAPQSPFTTAVFSNVTLIGPMGQDPNFDNKSGSGNYISGYNWGVTGIRPGIFQAAMQIRRNSRISCFNSVFTGYPVGLMLSNELPAGGPGTQEAANNGDLKIKNVFFAGMRMTGADIDSKTEAWTGAFSSTYFTKTEWNNTVYAPTDPTSSASILASINELKLKQFQSKQLPIPTTGFAADNATVNWGPTSGSPLLGAGDFTDAFLNDPFFTPVTYVGAFASDSDADNWLKDWTEFDPQNADY